MSNLEMWALIVGFFSPPVIALIQQPKWGERLRAVVTFLFAILVGGGTAYFNGELGFEGGTVKAILLVLVMAIGTYKGFWKPTRVAPTIETATSSSNQPLH